MVQKIDKAALLGDFQRAMKLDAFMINSAFPSGRPAGAVGVRVEF